MAKATSELVQCQAQLTSGKYSALSDTTRDMGE
jgi:hypothetical protein